MFNKKGGNFPGRLYFIAKESLRKVPIFGWAACKINMIIINRKSTVDAIETMKNVETFMMKHRVNIAISPEGTRRRKMSDVNDHSQNLGEFKKGAFHLAKNTETYLSPVIMYGANRLCPPKSFIFKQGKIFLVLQ